MRLAMIAPLVEAIPPRQYGGSERVVSLLVEELVRRGHAVTLFASGDSQTSAELVACCPRGLRLDPDVTDYVAYTVTQLGEVYDRAGEFDAIHNHVDYFAFPQARLCPTPTVTTTHGRLDLEEVRRVFRAFPEQPLVAISDDQRRSLPGVAWVATIHNGVDLDQYHFRPERGDYLVFLGRICPEKRPDRAIELARDVGMQLIIAAKVDPVDQDYYEHAIEPLIRDNPLIEFVGEVDERGKDALLGGAYAYLFPIDWPEPFGIVQVEALACGTPVLAMSRGSVPEVLRHGISGLVGNSLDELAALAPQIAHLNRRACRAEAERRFSARAMADSYEQVYHRVIAERQSEELARALGAGVQRVPTSVKGI